MNMYQDGDGNWVPAEPLGPQGIVAKVEFWLRAHNRLPWLANLLGRWDERNLGK